VSSEENVVFNLEVQVSELSMSELRKLELITYRAIGLLRRMGLPENIDAGIAKLQQLIMVVRLATTTLRAFQMAEAGTPFGLAMLGLSAAASTFAATDFMLNTG
jgi:hypothetical protein